MGVGRKLNINLKTGSGVVVRIVELAYKQKKKENKRVSKNMELGAHFRIKKFKKKENIII